MRKGLIAIIWISTILYGHTVAAQDKARELFKFAKFKFDKGEYKAALDFADRAIQADGNYASAYLLRADIYYRRGEYKKTVADVSAAIGCGAVSSSAYADYYLLRARSYLELELYEEAASDLELLFEGTVQNADIYYARAILRHHRGDAKGALDDLDRSILLSSDVARYYMHRARIREMTASALGGAGALGPILSDLSVVLALEPQNYSAYEMRSRIRQRLGQRVDAIADYSKMIELNAKDARAFYQRGVLTMQECRYAEAIADFGKALELNPGDYLSSRNSAICHQNMERHLLAVREYTRALQLMETAAEADFQAGELQVLVSETLLMRGHCYHFLRQPGDACRDFLQAYNLGNKKGLNYHRKYCGVY